MRVTVDVHTWGQWLSSGPDRSFFAKRSCGSSMYACVDSKATHLGTRYSNIAFSAESNNVFWGKVEGQRVFRVFVDVKPVYEGKSPYAGGLQYGVWEPQADGSLRFLVEDATSISQFR